MEAESLVGNTFGSIKVLKALGRIKSRKVSLCQCQCGREWVVDNRYLKNGDTKSCGKCGISGNYKHGHGKSAAQSPTYQTWMGMYNRCNNTKQRSHKNYGGIGITVCDRWRKSFENFLADMGERPDGMTLDRIDVNGNYEHSNCRWATTKQQYENKLNLRNALGQFTTKDKYHVLTIKTTSRSQIL